MVSLPEGAENTLPTLFLPEVGEFCVFRYFISPILILRVPLFFNGAVVEKGAFVGFAYSWELLRSNMWNSVFHLWLDSWDV
jgi:hypothetical protein